MNQYSRRTCCRTPRVPSRGWALTVVMFSKGPVGKQSGILLSGNFCVLPIRVATDIDIAPIGVSMIHNHGDIFYSEPLSNDGPMSTFMTDYLSRIGAHVEKESIGGFSTAYPLSKLIVIGVSFERPFEKGAHSRSATCKT